MTLDGSNVAIENQSPVEASPANYNDIIIQKLGLSKNEVETLPSELYLLLRHAHGNRMQVENGESYTAENTTGLFAQLGAWYERQPNKETARQRLRKAQVVFYDGKHVGAINEEYGRVVGDTVIAAHHQSFSAHNNPSDQQKPYESMNCSLGGDEGFAFVIPQNENEAIDLKQLKEEINANTQKIEKRWLGSKHDLKDLPSEIWEKNWYIAPLEAIDIDPNLEHMRRASDAAALIELMVDKIKKHKPNNQKAYEELTEKILNNLLERAQYTIFSGEVEYKPRQNQLPNKIVKMRNKLTDILKKRGATEKQQNIIDGLSERAPYSELFTQQAILDRSEFVEVTKNILDQKTEGIEENSLEHALMQGEKKSLDENGKPRRWQLAILSSRRQKQANTEGRLEGTKELWMVADTIQNTTKKLGYNQEGEARACVGKSGGSFTLLIFASDNEAFDVMKNIYEEEIKIRNSKTENAIRSPLDLHITTSLNNAHASTSEEGIEEQLDSGFGDHYLLETLQTLAQTNALTQVPKFILERLSRRGPQAGDIIFQLWTNIMEKKFLKKGTRTLQAARAASRTLGLVMDTGEPVLPLRNLVARNVRNTQKPDDDYIE